MTDQILIALISFAGTLAGSLAGIFTASRLSNYRIEQLEKKVDKHNNLVVIEHNLDLIKTADYLIDLGPEGGDGGGTIVAKGTPEQVAKVEKSFTGQYLKPLL